MSDIFNLASVNSDIFLTISKLSALHFLCGEYIKNVDSKKGEDIANVLEEINENFYKIKDDIVKMLYILENNEKE